jgi:outer membrane protein assembly factor BamB
VGIPRYINIYRYNPTRGLCSPLGGYVLLNIDRDNMRKNLLLLILLLALLGEACSANRANPNCAMAEHVVGENNSFQLLWSKSSIYVLPSVSNPTIQGISSRIFVGVQNSYYGASKVIAFDTKTGDPLWQQNVNLSMTMLADSENLYVGDYNRIIVYDPQTGDLTKEIKFPKVGVVHNIYSDEKNLYANTGNGTWLTYNINAGTADISEPLLPYTPFIRENEILYLIDAEGFKALQTETETTLWKYPIDEPINIQPLFTNDLIIITTQIGSLHVLNKETGELLWRSDAHVISNIAAHSSQLYFLTGEGYLAVVDKSDGREIEKLAFLPASFDMSNSDRIVGGYNVWIDPQDNIIVVSLGDSCQLMAFKLELS